jgi:ribosomal protein L37AE/L43A
VYGFISGISDSDAINYCPFCGGEIDYRYADGTAHCSECGAIFGVVQVDGDPEEE